jgi:hypothetical protein
VGAGTGLLYLVRWFWWRVTAWCEIVAMISSFAISVAFLLLHRGGVDIGTHRELLFTVVFTTICWLATAYLGPENDTRTLIEFYKKVRPFGPGWEPIRIKAGISKEEASAEARGANIPLALAGWSAGCAMIWSALFMVGNFLYGRTGYALALGAVFLISGTIVTRVVNRLWR